MIEALDIADVKLIAPKIFRDARGFFSETYNRRTLADAGLDVAFVQDNHPPSRDAGPVRGLHFQKPPHAQGKLVRVVTGAILDVAVDIRAGSPTFGRHIAVELSADNWQQLYVPAGFAHGFCTLKPDTEVVYKTTAYYDAASDAAIQWDDPAIGIDWPVARDVAVLSDKDRAAPPLSEIPDYFTFEGAQ
ncbi:MAG: dTDP-4-dehydrorhamnose 3,5-epimerase [Pseudomonadota bacterium]